MIRCDDAGPLSRDVGDAVKFDLEGKTTKPPDEWREHGYQKSHHLRAVYVFRIGGRVIKQCAPLTLQAISVIGEEHIGLFKLSLRGTTRDSFR